MKGSETMTELKKLIDLKTIVTLSLTFTFVYLAIVKYISVEDFKLIYVMVITYYFTREKKEAGDGTIRL